MKKVCNDHAVMLLNNGFQEEAAPVEERDRESRFPFIASKGFLSDKGAMGEKRVLQAASVLYACKLGSTFTIAPSRPSKLGQRHEVVCGMASVSLPCSPSSIRSLVGCTVLQFVRATAGRGLVGHS